MLRIERLRIEIQTEDGLYGIDEVFSNGLNFLASKDNTCGKSSILEAIYYGLGFEEIIGGKGEKVLTSAYKTYIECEERKLAVLESKIYLQISNGQEHVTLYRAAKMQNRDHKLITVYYSEMENISESILFEDMYVHMAHSAEYEKGFHSFLEKFLHLELPKVPATDGNQRKLYLQLVFSCMFIEQKHGWGDIFSGMPILGIKDSKKRVLEYVMKLDTLINEKQKDFLKSEEARIKREWEFLLKEIVISVARDSCEVVGLPGKPCIMTKLELSGIHILKNRNNIHDYIIELEKKYSNIERMKPKVVDNFDEMQDELYAIETDISEYEKTVRMLREHLSKEKATIKTLIDNLEIIENDLRNNKDAARLRNLGSELGCFTSKDKCPICHQTITDSLLTVGEGIEVMSIDENIRHLEAQKIMISYALESHKNKRAEMDKEIENISGKIFTLRRLAKTLRSDLYSVNDSLSETVLYKKIALQAEKDRLNGLIEFVDAKKEMFMKLSEQWKKYLEGKKKLPQSKFTDNDLNKISLLRSIFVKKLADYGYKSVTSMEDIAISQENYLPVIEEFDMKFDSSASDNIRGIWAYTVALMQVSIQTKGNHPAILIFDEPVQHSIVSKDMEKFFESLSEISNECQTIIGITVKDKDTLNAIERLEKNTYSWIKVQNKAFQKLT